MTTDRQRVAVEVFWKLHEKLPKQAPGSDDSTRRALGLVTALPARPRILDLGCGPGRQTLVLARETGGQVTAIDVLPHFLDEVNERAEAAGLGAQIETQCTSMLGLDEEDASVDLIWSEGAIYNVGFSTGLADWHRLLRPGGAVAVTDATWLVPSPPEPVRQFWQQEYPAMQDVSANEAAVARAGYRSIDTFVIPQNEWWDDYYSIIDERIETLRGQSDDAAWHAALDEAETESNMVRDYGDTFGYVFYIMQKPGNPFEAGS